MRKWNSVISLLLVGLVILHVVMGGFQLMGIMPGGSALMHWAARAMMALLAVHVGIGLVLTWESWRISRKAGRFYLRENALFLARRISGLAMLVLLPAHVLLFTAKQGAFRLQVFDRLQLLCSLLLVISLLVHLLTNIRPLLAALGIAGFGEYVKDILVVLAVLCLFGAAAFVLYYLRWNVFWRY